MNVFLSVSGPRWLQQSAAVAIVTVGLVTSLAGCGYKGDLELPPPPAPPAEDLVTPPAH